jgi:Glycosyltransferase Family 4
MRVAVLAPAWFAVPPTGYGGIEWIVALLADGLVDAGHEVTLFASGDSRTKAKLAAIYPEAPSREIGRTFPELKHALSCFARADEFEIINDHTGMLGAVLAGRRARRDLRPDRPSRTAGRPDLDLDEPAQADAASELGRELPQRTRLLRLSV